MTMTRKRFAFVAVVAIVLGGLLTAAMWASTRGSARSPYPMMGGAGYRSGYGAMMGRPGMMNGAMAGPYALPGDGRRVDSLAAARQRAQLFADRLGLRTGEVLQFSNGFYAELLTTDGAGATEVLIDPANGAVTIEYGPAMMWNTAYGMHAAAPAGAAQLSASQARDAAQRWLDDRRRGLTAGEPEQFPGYYTMETLRNGKIDGMMSVNAATGAVWYHTWHGSFIAASDE